MNTAISFSSIYQDRSVYLDSLALGDLARFPACFGAHLSNVFVAESLAAEKQELLALI